MTGLVWTAAIWGLMTAGAFALRHRVPRLREFFTRENLALMIALLGTFSITPGFTEAEEVLREPVVLERVVRGGLAALAFAIALPLLINRLHGPRLAGYKATGAIVVYLGVSLISTIYSTAPLVTAAKVFEMAAGVAAILAIAYGPDASRRLKDALTLVVVAMTALLTVGVVGFFVVPDLFAPFETRPGFVTLRTLGPPYMYSNAVSSVSALVTTFALARFLDGGEDRRAWAGVIPISVLGLILSSGRQGVAMALVGVGLVLWAKRRRLLVFFMGPALIITFFTYQDAILQALGRDRPGNWITLTGRLPWWEAAFSAWGRHPWTGWGYASGGRFVALESIGGGAVSSVHSGYLEVLVGVGIIGLIPFLYALGRVVIWSWRQMAARSETAIAVLIFPLVLRTAVSSGFGGWLNAEFVLFFLLAAIADRSWIEGRRDSAIGGPDEDRIGQDSRLSSSTI